MLRQHGTKTFLAFGLGCCLLQGCLFDRYGKPVEGDGGGDAPVLDSDVDVDQVPDTDACTGPDSDGDGVADPCDPCPNDREDDSDGDGSCDSADLCPGHDDTIDSDGDGTPNGCDTCPDDGGNDSDNDTVCDAVDLCPGHDDRQDRDGDGAPDGCDTCPDSNPDDVDNDDVCDSVDICLEGDDAVDRDNDGTPDACDPCPLDSPDDSDNDGVCGSDDACPGHDDRQDVDGDGKPDGCDLCHYDGPSVNIPVAITAEHMVLGVTLNDWGNVVTVRPGARVKIVTGYTIGNCFCGDSCDYQIEIGVDSSDTPSYCAFDDVAPCPARVGTHTSRVAAPNRPGGYEIRFNLGEAESCDLSSWYDGLPPRGQTVGAICVTAD